MARSDRGVCAEGRVRQTQPGWNLAQDLQSQVVPRSWMWHKRDKQVAVGWSTSDFFFNVST